MYCETPDKEAVREAREKEPIICKLVDFVESRASMIQTASVCSAQTTNIGRGTPVYMAPELLSMDIPRWLWSYSKRVDTWSYCMVMLLNPVLQFPYQVEIEELHPTTYEMYKREVVNLLTSKQLPTFSDKFGRFQATTWLMLEQVFEKCADFDSTNKIKASYLVETFDHTLIRRSSLQKHITCWEHFCWATSCRRKCHSYVKRSFGSCNKLLLFHVGADCWTHFGWKGEMATFPASTLL